LTIETSGLYLALPSQLSHFPAEARKAGIKIKEEPEETKDSGQKPSVSKSARQAALKLSAPLIESPDLGTDSFRLTSQLVKQNPEGGQPNSLTTNKLSGPNPDLLLSLDAESAIKQPSLRLPKSWESFVRGMASILKATRGGIGIFGRHDIGGG